MNVMKKQSKSIEERKEDEQEWTSDRNKMEEGD
jgi:hypothetical protein